MQYTGEYRAGLMHGRGQMCWPDGSVCVLLHYYLIIFALLILVLQL